MIETVQAVGQVISHPDMSPDVRAQNLRSLVKYCPEAAPHAYRLACQYCPQFASEFAPQDATPARSENCAVEPLQVSSEVARDGTAPIDCVLAMHANHAGEMRLFWLWAIVRYLDSSGAVYLDDLYTRAKRFDPRLTPRMFGDFVRDGRHAGYWTLTRQARRGQAGYRRRLFYTGYDRLADRLNIDETNPPGWTPAVYISLRWNNFDARCYAGWIAANCERRGLRALPISRAELVKQTGASVPTLIVWEAAAGISVQPGKVQVASDAPGFALIDLPEHATIYLTSTGQERHEYRTVNRYHPPTAIRFSTSKRTRLTVRRHCMKTCSEHSLSAFCPQPVKAGDRLPGVFERVYFVGDDPVEAAERADNYARHSKRAQFSTRRNVFLGQDRRGYARFEWLVAPGLLTDLNEQATPDYATRPADYIRFMQRRATERWIRSACYA